MLKNVKIEFPKDEKKAVAEIAKDIQALPLKEKQAIFYMIQGAKLVAGANSKAESTVM